MSKMIRIVLAVLGAALLAHYVWLISRGAGPAAVEAPLTTEESRYVCPMHPEVNSPTPGRCPICGMDLQKQKVEAAQPPAPPSQYVCPMHPEVIAATPGRCPICGMDLQEQQSEAARSDSHAGHDHGDPSPEKKERKIAYYRHPMGKSVTSPTPLKDEMGMDFIPVYEDEAPRGAVEAISGRVPFDLPAASQQLIGVKKAVVERQTLDYEIRSSGRVAFDPALYGALAEYRVAKHAAAETRGAASSVRDSTGALVAAAKLKLELLGISAEQLREFERESFDPKSLLLPEGTVWVYADVYEYEVPHLRVGQTVSVDSPLFPTERFTGRVVSVSPVINPATRTVNVRAEVADPKRLLKPDMFLTVRIETPLGEHLVIPEDSVIHTGDVDLVFVFDSAGRFEPRRIGLGMKTQGKAIVAAGLDAGETVAAGANFLIDSESRLKAVVQRAATAALPKGD